MPVWISEVALHAAADRRASVLRQVGQGVLQAFAEERKA